MLLQWAGMKHNDQHSSLDTPPLIPLFSGTTSKPPKQDSLSDALTSATAVVGLIKGSFSAGVALSSGKCARVSGQYLKHLEKLRHLHDLGVLSTEEQKSFCPEYSSNIYVMGLRFLTVIMIINLMYNVLYCDCICYKIIMYNCYNVIYLHVPTVFSPAVTIIRC